MDASILPGPIKSQSDLKDYRLIKLANGLHALLISDLHSNADNDKCNESNDDDGFSDCSEDSCDKSDCSEECMSEESTDSEDCESDDGNCQKDVIRRKQSAAALCIGVGSYSDPDNIPGLAHFLEHMVFMGSEKFPDENHFDMFIQRHGGNDNASTDCEKTIFQFEINPAYLKQALSIWAQFFISPLMKQNSIDREVQAVDSEFQMALVNDECRREQIMGSLCKTNHPIGKFLWGNAKTLKEEPERKGIKVYDALCNFHKHHYNAKSMTLAIQSTESLDLLQEWVTEIFCDVPNNTEAMEISFNPDVPFPREDEPAFQLYHVVPVKNTQTLYMTWFLAPQHKHYKVKPLHYVSWLLGHEGKGSILSLLKQKHLALGLCTEAEKSGFDSNSFYSILSVEVSLTEKGCQNYAEVMDIVFQYLHMLCKKGPVERIYREIQRIEEIDFTYKEEETPLTYVEEVCEYMQLYPQAEILTGGSLLVSYDPEIIQDVLESLTPEKCLTLLHNSANKDMPNTMKEHWFGTTYSVTMIDEKWRRKWSDPCRMKISPELHIPSPNPFIAENFELVNCASADCHSQSALVVRQLPTEDASCKLWFKEDLKFGLPKAYVRLLLINPCAAISPENSAYLDLMISILNHNIAEVVYNADVASIYHSILGTTKGGMILKVCGYNDKLSLLLEAIVKYLVEFTTTEEVFAEHKLQVRRAYYNQILSPNKMCKNLRLTVLEKLRFSLLDKYSSSAHLDKAGLLRFANHFNSSFYVEGLVQGNYTDLEAANVLNRVTEILKCSILTHTDVPAERVLQIPSNSQLIKVKSFNSEDDNSKITVYLQVGPHNIHRSVLMQLLTLTMEEPCFNILRTQKQLGYSVHVQDHNTMGVLGLSVSVQTQNSKFSVEDCTDAMMDFLFVSFANFLEEMLEEEFQAQVSSLIALKTNEDSHLGEEVGRNWDEILLQDYNFKRLDQEVKHLKEISFTEFKNFYKEACLKNKKVLTIQVRGNSPVVNGESITVEKPATPVKDVSSLPQVQITMLDPIEGTSSIQPSQIRNLEKFMGSGYYYPMCHTLDS